MEVNGAIFLIGLPFSGFQAIRTVDVVLRVYGAVKVVEEHSRSRSCKCSSNGDASFYASVEVLILGL